MVTIVIPYIDEINFLEEALQSALDQELDDVEIIVVCNDRVFDAQLIPLPGMYSNVIWLHEPIPGSAFARNKGLHFASGEWIQFLDVDDLLLPGKIAHQISNTRGEAIVSPHLYQRLNGKTEPSKWNADDIWTGLLDSGLGSTSSMLWNTKALKDVGGWSANYQSHQEYELLFRLLMAGYSIVPVNDNKTIVRERISGSITHLTKQVRAKEGIKLRETMWNFIVENFLGTTGRKNAFLQYTFRQLRGLYRTEPEVALMLFKKYYTDGKFIPEKNSIPLYKMLFNLFGFQRSEKLFKFYSSIRDKYLPFLPKNN